MIFWIIEYGATFSEWFLGSIFCGTFIKDVDLKSNLFKRLAVSAVFSGIMLFVNSFELYSPISVGLCFIIIISAQFVIYCKNLLKLSISSTIFLLMMAICDNIVVSMVSYYVQIPTAEIYEKMSLYRVIAIIGSKVLLMLITIILNKLLSKQRVLQIKYLIILFVISVFMLSLTFIITFLDLKNKAVNSYVSILFFLIMLVLIIVVFFGTFKLTEYYYSQQKLKLTLLKNQMLEQSMNETEKTFMLWKESLHNYKHNIMHLTALANNSDLQGIKNYLEKENDLLGKTLFYYKTDNDTVDIILNVKQKYAESEGITFMVNAEVPKSCKISSADFSSMLGNLIDNAIEASEKETNPFIEVKIKPVKEFIIICISNKYTGDDMSLKTTKCNNKQLHGIGLHSVRQTVKKYNGEFKVEKSDDIFNAKLMIPM